MKSAEFADRLDKVALIFESAQAIGAANALKSLAPIFRVLPDKTVADIIKRLSAQDIPSGSFLQSKVDPLAAALSALEKFVATIAPKATAADFSALNALLQKHRSAGLEQFVTTATEALTRAPVAKSAKAKKPLRTDLVESYNKRLEDSLGDDAGFRTIFAQLERDSDVTNAELIALAKRFALASVKGRDQALKKIFSRHQALMISRAASRATAGRIAG